AGGSTPPIGCPRDPARPPSRRLNSGNARKPSGMPPAPLLGIPKNLVRTSADVRAYLPSGRAGALLLFVANEKTRTRPREGVYEENSRRLCRVRRHGEFAGKCES